MTSARSSESETTQNQSPVNDPRELWVTSLREKLTREHSKTALILKIWNTNLAYQDYFIKDQGKENNFKNLSAIMRCRVSVEFITAIMQIKSLIAHFDLTEHLSILSNARNPRMNDYITAMPDQLGRECFDWYIKNAEANKNNYNILRLLQKKLGLPENSIVFSKPKKNPSLKEALLNPNDLKTPSLKEALLNPTDLTTIQKIWQTKDKSEWFNYFMKNKEMRLTLFTAFLNNYHNKSILTSIIDEMSLDKLFTDVTAEEHITIFNNISICTLSKTQIKKYVPAMPILVIDECLKLGSLRQSYITNLLQKNSTETRKLWADSLKEFLSKNKKIKKCWNKRPQWHDYFVTDKDNTRFDDIKALICYHLSKELIIETLLLEKLIMRFSSEQHAAILLNLPYSQRIAHYIDTIPLSEIKNCVELYSEMSGENKEPNIVYALSRRLTPPSISPLFNQPEVEMPEAGSESKDKEDKTFFPEKKTEAASESEGERDKTFFPEEKTEAASESEGEKDKTFFPKEKTEAASESEGEKDKTFFPEEKTEAASESEDEEDKMFFPEEKTEAPAETVPAPVGFFSLLEELNKTNDLPPQWRSPDSGARSYAGMFNQQASLKRSRPENESALTTPVLNAPAQKGRKTS